MEEELKEGLGVPRIKTPEAARRAGVSCNAIHQWCFWYPTLAIQPMKIQGAFLIDPVVLQTIIDAKAVLSNLKRK